MIACTDSFQCETIPMRFIAWLYLPHDLISKQVKIDNDVSSVPHA